MSQVVRGEGLGDVEVVVEAVGDRRADAEFGVRVDLLHRLRQHVRAGVTQHRQAVGLVGGDGLHPVAIVQRRVEVAQFAADRATITARSSKILRRRAVRHFGRDGGWSDQTVMGTAIPFDFGAPSLSRRADTTARPPRARQ